MTRGSAGADGVFWPVGGRGASLGLSQSLIWVLRRNLIPFRTILFHTVLSEPEIGNTFNADVFTDTFL